MIKIINSTDKNVYLDLDLQPQNNMLRLSLSKTYDRHQFKLQCSQKINHTGSFKVASDTFLLEQYPECRGSGLDPENNNLTCESCDGTGIAVHVKYDYEGCEPLEDNEE